MLKRIILATIVVFVIWSILDFLIHGMFLLSTYQETANLWRPENEMNMPLMSVVTLIFSVCFVSIYGYMIKLKSLMSGIKFGVLFGIAVGVSMGLGTYSFMPIPLSMAFSWFVGSLIKMSFAGIVVGLIFRTSDK